MSQHTDTSKNAMAELKCCDVMQSYTEMEINPPKMACGYPFCFCFVLFFAIIHTILSPGGMQFVNTQLHFYIIIFLRKEEVLIQNSSAGEHHSIKNKNNINRPSCLPFGP